MNRVWTALLIALTAAVLGGVVYVLGHNTKVPQAGQTPGYSAPPASTSTSAVAEPSSAPASTSSTAPAGSSSSTSTQVATSSSAANTQSVLIAFVGDEYTHGVGGSGGAKTFPSLVAAALHVQYKSYYVDDAGYAKSDSNGHSYADLVDMVIAAHPDIVVVTGGRNDRPDDPTTLASKAKQLFADLRAGLPSAKIIGVAPWWGDSAQPPVLAQIATAVQNGVTAAGGTYFDITDPLFGHPSYMADDADPDDAGYAAIATSLEAKLQALLP